jgi:2-haloacid dehalogenase
VTGDALDHALDTFGLVVDEHTRARLLGAWLDVKPYPEVRGALDRLGSRRRLAVLSNGSPDMLEAGLAAAGLRGRFDHVLSVDGVGVFKPHPSVYELAVKAFGLPAERILFVSSNGWDAFGARAFGMPVAWINRRGAPLERLGTPPNFVVPDLDGLAEAVG